MSPENADTLVRWTARIVVALYLYRCWLDFKAALHFDQDSDKTSDSKQTHRFARWLWTIAVVLFAVHVGSALAFVHDFSHHKAYQHTAERTAAVIGVDWGGGIYFNHAFLIYWLTDVALWWVKGPDWPYKSRGYYWAMQTTFAFMFVNATIVFGPAHWIYISVLLVVVVLLLTVLKKRGQFLKYQ